MTRSRTSYVSLLFNMPAVTLFENYKGSRRKGVGYLIPISQCQIAGDEIDI